MLIAHADNKRALALVTAKDYDGLANFLAGLIRSTAAGGADLAPLLRSRRTSARRSSRAFRPCP